jgi:hypothetical protein
MSDEPLQGSDYRAVTRLSNGDDDVTYAEIGETCERVPVESLEGLLGHGYIELATASGDRAVQAAKDALAKTPPRRDGPPDHPDDVPETVSS